MTEEKPFGPDGIGVLSKGSRQTLRRRAEDTLQKKAAGMVENMEALSPEEVMQLVHELRVHQIELTMQNEELRRTQAELDASRARYFDLYDLAPVGYFTLSEAGLILEVNLTAATLLGVARSALIKRRWISLILPEDQDIDYRHRKLLFETGAPQVCELRLLKKDAVPFWVRIDATAAQDADGAPVCRATMIDITDRKQAEETLQESEERYRNVFQHHAAIKLLIDPDTGSIIEANDAAVDYYGWSHDRLKQMKIQEINTLPPEDVKEEMEKARTKKQTHFEFRHRRADGSIRDVAVFSSNIKVKRKDLLHSIIHDITERKRAEEALHAANAYNRSLIEASLDPLVTIGADGKITDVNASTEAVTGYTRTELIGTEFSVYFTEPEQARAGYQEVFRAGSVCDHPLELRHRDGHVTSVLYNASVYRDEKGQVVGVFAAARDITDRKRAEEALRESESKYRSIFENAMEGIYQSTPEGRFIMVNAAFARMAGYDSPEELIESIENIGTQLYVHPEDRDRFAELMAKRGMVENFEVEFYRKDGSAFWVVTNSHAVKDDQGKILCYEGVDEDITLRKQAEEKLQQTLDNLRKSYSTTVQVLVATVESRDPYTAGHQLRSADLARAMATEMGLSQERIDGIRLAGSIHDIGKLSIPVEILSKPTKLSELEFRMIQEHSRQGYEILKDVASPWPLAEIVHQHHERMDGSGYPRHLKGEKIRMEARILAIADVVESMASHRPYRAARGLKAALEEIENHRGTLYDAAAADACLRLFREKGFQLEGTKF